MANQRDDMDDRQQEDYWLDYEYQQHLEQQAEQQTQQTQQTEES